MISRNLCRASLYAAAIVVLCAASTGAAPAGKADSDKPLKGEWNFAPVLEWSFDRMGADTLKRPAEPRVSRDGKLFFHDFDRQVSYIVGEKGDLVAVFGGAGDGPGMVSRYMNCFTSDGRVIIASPDKLHFFDHKGAFQSSAPNNLFESFPLVFTSDRVFYTAPGALVNLPDGKAAIKRVDSANGETKPIHEFTLGEGEKMNFPGVIVGLIPQILMGYDPVGGRLYFGRNDRYEIFASDLDGKIIGSFGLPKQKVQVTEENLRRRFAELKMPAERIERMVPLLPRNLTYFHRLQVLDGLVYVFTVDAFDSRIGKQHVDIFSSDGSYLYRGTIGLPEGDRYENFDQLVLSNGFLHVILTDDDGGRRVARYRVTMPPR